MRDANAPVVRLDPHLERIRRNRLHPRHYELAERHHRWMGARGVMRVDPHALGAIGPNGIKRIDRSGAAIEAASGRTTTAQEQRREIVIDSPDCLIAVVPECPDNRLSSHDRDLLGLARQLADRDPAQPGAVLAVTFAREDEGIQAMLGEAGADRWMTFEGEEYAGYTPEIRLAALEAVERQLAPRHWLLPDGPAMGSDLGRRLAARLASSGEGDERAMTRLWRVAEDIATARAGGDRFDIQRTLPKVGLALAECAEPVNDTRHQARRLEAPSSATPWATRVIDRGAVAVDPARIALSQAPFILSGGRGIGDWAGFHAAAQSLGAAVGASRVAVDDGHIPRDRQVGATGTFVTAGCYIAVGISGAVQHLQGIAGCERVIAINPDPGCDMVKRANLSLIGDGDAILAAVIHLLERGSEVLDDAA